MTSSVDTLNDLQAEEAVIACILVSDVCLRFLLVDEGLRPNHFVTVEFGALFDAASRIYDRRERVESTSLAIEARTTRERLEQLHCPVAANARVYARRVVESSWWRAYTQANLEMTDAIEARDRPRAELAQQMFATPLGAERSTYTPDMLRALVEEMQNDPEAEALPWPLPSLRHGTGDGPGRGDVALIGGATNWGKSIILDQWLHCCARDGLKTHLYINEMTVKARVKRMLKYCGGDLVALRVGITDATGWSAEEIARHISANDWDAVGIDHLHLIAHEEERDMARISRVINVAAKQNNVLIVAAVQLSEKRVTGQKIPRPALTDIRASGMLKNDADFVLFVYREQNETGRPELDGSLYLAKVRDGGLGQAVEVRLNPDYLRFEAVDNAF